MFKTQLMLVSLTLFLGACTGSTPESVSGPLSVTITPGENGDSFTVDVGAGTGDETASEEVNGTEGETTEETTPEESVPEEPETSNPSPSEGEGTIQGGEGGQPLAHCVVDNTQLSTQNSWYAQDMPYTNSNIQVSFSMRASAQNIDAFLALLPPGDVDFGNMLATIRFSRTGLIDVRDGDSYVADVAFPYEAGLWYEVSVAANLETGKYVVGVSDCAGNSAVINSLADFRSGVDYSQGISQLALWAADDNSGIEVANVSWVVPEGVTPPPVEQPEEPVVEEPVVEEPVVETPVEQPEEPVITPRPPLPEGALDDLAQLPLATYSDLFGNFLGGFKMNSMHNRTAEADNPAFSSDYQNIDEGMRVSLLQEAMARYTRGVFAVSEDDSDMYISGFDYGWNSCYMYDGVAKFKMPPLVKPMVPGDMSMMFEADELDLWSSLMLRIPHESDECLTDYAGMAIHDNKLYFMAIKSYDADLESNHNLGIVEDLDNFGSSEVKGLYRLGYPSVPYSGRISGWITSIPEYMQSFFGGETHIAGGAAPYSINGRHSLGPTLYTFSLNDIPEDASVQSNVDVDVYMEFPISKSTEQFAMGKQLTGGEWNAYNCTPSADSACRTGPPTPYQLVEPCNGDNCLQPVWTIKSDAKVGFIVPGTRTYAVIGKNGCLETGCAYKTTREDGFQCDGPCPVRPYDMYAYYWLFDLEDVLSLGPDEVYKALPYDHGKIDELRPYTATTLEGGQIEHFHGVPMDAYWNPDSSRLYITLEEGAELKGGSPPAVMVFQVR